MDRRNFLRVTTSMAALSLLGPPAGARATSFDVSHSPQEWLRLLGSDRFRILRQAATEPAWSSPLLKEHRRGVFACAGCDLPLFSSATKFDSGTGWPSFYKPFNHAVITRPDYSLGTERTEVLCRRCGGHLGHVFNDGPQPTGLRYCMDGLALQFHPS
jgi:peptide-methionine (R)-S-oxide reductase